MSVNKTGNGSGFQIDGSGSANQGTVTPDRVAGNAGNTMGAGDLQDQHAKLSGVTAERPVSLVKDYGLPNPEGEHGHEGEVDHVLAAFGGGTAFDPMSSGAMATVTPFHIEDNDNYAGLDEALAAATEKPHASFHDVDIAAQGGAEFLQNAFLGLHGIANQRTGNPEE